MRTHGLRRLSVECLEQRRCLAASIGWDGPGPGSAELLYSIGPIPEQLDRQQVETAIEAALDVWSDVADLEFNRTTQSGQEDAIDIRFKSLDGPGGTLARAYFPDDLNRNPIAGDVEFDIGEQWEVGNRLGSAAYDLMLVAVHEIGHALGLSHSGSESAVMHHSVSSQSQFTGLSSEDVSQVRDLYAAAPPPQTAAPAAIPPDSNTNSSKESATRTASSYPAPSPAQPTVNPPRTDTPGEHDVPVPANNDHQQPNRETKPPNNEVSAWALLRYRLSLMRTALLRLSFSSSATDVDSVFADPDWTFG